jgi:hypothetical protein
MWPLALVVAALGGYYFYSKQQTASAPAQPASPANPPLPNIQPPAPGAPGATPANPALNLPNLANVATLPPPLAAHWSPIGSGVAGPGSTVNITIGGTPIPVPTFQATIGTLLADGITAVINMPLMGAPSIPGVSLPSQFWATKITA